MGEAVQDDGDCAGIVTSIMDIVSIFLFKYIRVSCFCIHFFFSQCVFN